MREIKIRGASLDDAGGINAIYNPLIRDSAVTFETVEWSILERRDWIAAHGENPRHPVVVADLPGGAICGFASASAFDPRGAYETSVKVSVFVEPQCHGEGVGGRLYKALFTALGRADIHRAYALIVAPNLISVALHKRFGFAQIASLNEVGRKFGNFYDVLWFEKRL